MANRLVILRRPNTDLRRVSFFFEEFSTLLVFTPFIFSEPVLTKVRVAVRIFERLREMLGNQQSKVGVIRLLFGVFVAMTVDGNNSIRVFIYYCTLGVHTEGADLITVFFGSIYYHNLVE